MSLNTKVIVRGALITITSERNGTNSLIGMLPSTTW